MRRNVELAGLAAATLGAHPSRRMTEDAVATLATQILPSRDVAEVAEDYLEIEPKIARNRLKAKFELHQTRLRESEREDEARTDKPTDDVAPSKHNHARNPADEVNVDDMGNIVALEEFEAGFREDPAQIDIADTFNSTDHTSSSSEDINE